MKISEKILNKIKNSSFSKETILSNINHIILFKMDMKESVNDLDKYIISNIKENISLIEYKKNLQNILYFIYKSY